MVVSMDPSLRYYLSKTVKGSTIALSTTNNILNLARIAQEYGLRVLVRSYPTDYLLTPSLFPPEDQTFVCPLTLTGHHLKISGLTLDFIESDAFSEFLSRLFTEFRYDKEIKTFYWKGRVQTPHFHHLLLMYLYGIRKFHTYADVEVNDSPLIAIGVSSLDAHTNVWWAFTPLDLIPVVVGDVWPYEKIHEITLPIRGPISDDYLRETDRVTTLLKSVKFKEGVAVIDSEEAARLPAIRLAEVYCPQSYRK